MLKGAAVDGDGQIAASPGAYPLGKRSAVHKVAEVLMAVNGGHARSLTSISEETGLPLSTTFRIANELVESGLLRRSGEGFYSMAHGPSAVALSDHARLDSTIPPAVITVLDDLTAVTHKISRFGFRQGAHIVSLTRTSNRVQPEPHARIDHRPLHGCAMGKVLLAFGTRPDPPNAMTEEPASHSANTLTERNDLLQQLARIRRNLVAYDFGELAESNSTIAVPVLAAGQFAVSALELQSSGDPDLRCLEYAARTAARILRRLLLSETGPDCRG